MSRHLVPKRLRESLRKLADANCPDCYGEGFVTFTDRNPLGYTEVRCTCCNRDGNDQAADRIEKESW